MKGAFARLETDLIVDREGASAHRLVGIRFDSDPHPGARMATGLGESRWTGRQTQHVLEHKDLPVTGLRCFGGDRRIPAFRRHPRGKRFDHTLDDH